MDKVPEGYTPDQPLKCSDWLGCPKTDQVVGVLLAVVGLMGTIMGGFLASDYETSGFQIDVRDTGAYMLASSLSGIGFGITLLFSANSGYDYKNECIRAKKSRQEWLIIDAKKADKTKQPELRTLELIKKRSP